MACPFNITVCISERFFSFPYEYVVPQSDVGGAPVDNLVIYVPTEEDIQYINTSQLTNFKSVLVYRQEFNNVRSETRLAKKNTSATVVYWNPIVPIEEIGVGETRVFSVLLTNDLFFCKTIIVDHNTPICPIEFRSRIEYKKLYPIGGEVPLFYLKDLLNDNINDFLICFNRETSIMVKILNIKRILSIFEYRKVPARYAINLPEQEVDNIYNKLTWERTRRLMKGDVSNKCVYVNRHSLMYVKNAQEMLGIKNYSRSIVDFVKIFQPLIQPYQIVPDIIIKLNTLERAKHVRLYCRGDSFAITSYGSVPGNMPDDNVIHFNYTDTNNNKNLFEVKSNLFGNNAVNDFTVTAARYNYFF
ncbi:odv-ec43 [Cryptophlebia peltastica nucleopolyhedrovirus]|uniref:Odv-ec43 n=1 Tax=Cryptophlebia peltastica nucleopolyhedrovirus TaxID=2304025 RepID=A0A346RNV3_9ABAC|nr:odv-ec43 [Cryptophlebia peltastica nucleopolyhedrovirus]AXS67750.1 odv-ec43 [Cryptophlebia peltastica nucleopolyhedrovirus]